MAKPDFDLQNITLHEKHAVLYFNRRLFDLSAIKTAAASFSDKAWVTIDGDDDEVLVELRPKGLLPVYILAKKFNKLILQHSLVTGLTGTPSPALFDRLRLLIRQFVLEEQGKVPKHAVIALGGLLTTLGLGSLVSEEVTASHMCSIGGDGGDGGDGGSSNACFTADQQVSTPAGPVAIGDLSVGDKVVSYDEASDMLTVSIIGKILVHDGRQDAIHAFNRYPLVDLSVEEKGGASQSRVTLNHPYYDPVGKSYKELLDFKVGDLVRTETGTGRILSITSVIDQTSPIADHQTVVYNLHMAQGPSNFLVNGVLVHNSDGTGK